MKQDFIFMSESVTEGHPDKLCDQISDAIVDQFLTQDPFSRVIAECTASTGMLFIATRFASKAVVDMPGVARQVIAQVGYDQEDFNARTSNIMTNTGELPPEVYSTVDERRLSDREIEGIPVRNQATVFGFACNQTPGLMPLPIWLAHKLARRLVATRLTRALGYLAPDGKTQVGVEFRDRRPHRIHSLTVIAAIDPGTAPGEARFRSDMMSRVIEPVFADEPIKPDADTRIFINPGGPYLIGGPAMHSGLTGRKNGVDTYGEYARHSGAALSGKDPTRIDRIGAYAARHAAKNVVAAGLADECEVQLSYSIGLSRPVSVQVETLGTGRLPDPEIAERIEREFDFRPAGIIARFNLRFLPGQSRRGFYRRLAAYGHVGRMDLGLPWEVTGRTAGLQAA